jgi:hypothetical protein
LIDGISGGPKGGNDVRAKGCRSVRGKLVEVEAGGVDILMEIDE